MARYDVSLLAMAVLLVLLAGRVWQQWQLGRKEVKQKNPRQLRPRTPEDCPCRVKTSPKPSEHSRVTMVRPDWSCPGQSSKRLLVNQQPKTSIDVGRDGQSLCGKSLLLLEEHRPQLAVRIL